MFAIRTLINNCKSNLRVNPLNIRLRNNFAKYSTKVKEEEEIDDGPIKYSTSPAIKWRAHDSRTGGRIPRLWYEPYVVFGSIAIFLIYFTMLREENDIDEDLSKTLYSRIAGLEESQLIASLEYNKRHGLDTTAIIARLKEIQQEKDKVS